MRSVCLALSILISSFWTTSLAAYDPDWTILEVGETLSSYQEGFTMEKSPTIYVDTLGIYWTRLYSLRFTLVDSRSMRLVAEVPLLLHAHHGLERIRLRDHDIELAQDVDYQWYVSLKPNQNYRRSEEITRERMKLAEGQIVRIAPKNLHSYRRSCEKDNVRWLADSGIWYDAFSCVNELIEGNPQDRTLRYLRGELLGKCRDPYDGMPLVLCPRKR